jgi:hypothetical protein
MGAAVAGRARVPAGAGALNPARRRFQRTPSTVVASPSVTPSIRWTPGIGDPTLVGWLTVLAYLGTGWLCLLAMRAERRGEQRPLRVVVASLLRVLRRERLAAPWPAKRGAVWLGLAVVMLALGINKQLDLQSLFTDVGRVIARSEGWYEQRRGVQALFIGGVSATAVLVLLALVWATRGRLRDLRPVLAGLVLVVAYVVVRATSLHAVDIFIFTELFGMRWNWILELGGLALMAGAIRRHLRRSGYQAAGMAPRLQGWMRRLRR